MDGQDRVPAIVFPAEHFLHLRRLHFVIERVERLRELGIHRFARFRPFDQYREIVALLLQRQHQLAVLLQAAAALQYFLRFELVFPEVRRGGAGFEAGQFVSGVGGFKDNSANRSPVC